MFGFVLRVVGNKCGVDDGSVGHERVDSEASASVLCCDQHMLSVDARRIR